MASNELDQAISNINTHAPNIRAGIDQARKSLKQLKEDLEKTNNDSTLSETIKKQMIQRKQQQINGIKENIEADKAIIASFRNVIFDADKDAKTVYLFERGKELFGRIGKLKDEKTNLSLLKDMMSDQDMKAALTKMFDAFKKVTESTRSKRELPGVSVDKDALVTYLKAAYDELESAYNAYPGPKPENFSDFKHMVASASKYYDKSTGIEDSLSNRISAIDEKTARRQEKLQQVYNEGIENGVAFNSFRSNMPVEVRVTDREPAWYHPIKRHQWKKKQKEENKKAKEWQDKVKAATEYGEGNHGFMHSLRNKLRDDLEVYIEDTARELEDDDRTAREKKEDEERKKREMVDRFKSAFDDRDGI